MKLIVADSSPLIALACSGHLQVLCSIVSTVVIPETVFQECVGDLSRPGAKDIDAAIAKNAIARLPDPADGTFNGIPDLDAGEAAALSLALLLDAPVLMDDAVGRQIARANKIGVVGACGILLKAKREGLIEEIRPIIHEWRSIGYFLSDALVAEVYRLAEED